LISTEVIYVLVRHIS